MIDDNYIDKPPYRQFWICEVLSRERGWMHSDIKKMPLDEVYTIVDYMIWQQSKRDNG